MCRTRAGWNLTCGRLVLPPLPLACGCWVVVFATFAGALVACPFRKEDLDWLLLKHEGMRVRVVCRSTDGVRVAKKKRLKNPLQTSLKTKEKHAGQKEKKAE